MENLKLNDLNKNTLKTLIEFLQDSYRDDPDGVNNWLAQGGQDYETVMKGCNRLWIALTGMVQVKEQPKNDPELHELHDVWKGK